MMGNGFGGYGMGFGFGGIGMILVWVLVIAAIVAAVRWLAGSNHANRTSDPDGHQREGLRVLEKRYARGELSRDEFLEKKHDLGA